MKNNNTADVVDVSDGGGNISICPAEYANDTLSISLR